MKKKIIVSAVLFSALAVPVLALPAQKVYADNSITVEFFLTEADRLSHQQDPQNNQPYLTQTLSSTNLYAQVPQTPAKDGRVFEYWLLGNQKFSFANCYGVELTENIELVAKWDNLGTEYYSVKFVANGQVLSVQEVAVGQAATAPNTIVAEGKTFSAWDKSFSNVTQDLVVNAQFVENHYTVKLLGFNGAVLDPITNVAHGTTIDFASYAPNLEHFVFVPYSQTITADTVVELQYAPKQYNVTFMNGNARHGEVLQVPYNQTVPFPELPEKANHVFVGWCTAEGQLETMFNFASPIASDMTLYAQFAPLAKPKFEVRFYDFDGVQYGGTQLVEQEQSAIVPGSPYREGFEFLGWNEDFSCVTQNMDIYPKYVAKTYQVRFVDARGLVGNVQTVKFGQSATEPTNVFEPEGQEFVCWDTSSKNITANTTINAKYRVKTHAVQFFTENFKQIGVVQYVQHGQAAIVPAAPQKVGYNFVKWAGNNDINRITAPAVFVPQYQPQTFEVVFADGEQIKKRTTVNYGDKLSYYAYQNPGYIFEGWWFVDGETEVLYDFNTPVTKNTTLHAKWARLPDVTFEVVFMVENQEYTRQLVKENGTALLPTDPASSTAGQVFDKWVVAGTQTQFTAQTVISAATQVQAVFKPAVFNVEFRDFDNTLLDAQTVQYGQSAIAPKEPTRTGYDFLNWAENFDCITEDLVVTAKYQVQYMQITFMLGESEYQKIRVPYNTHISMAQITPPNNLLYWETQQGEPFDFATRITSATTLTAVLKAVQYQVMFYANGQKIAEQLVGENQTVALPSENLVPAVEGKEFSGVWMNEGTQTLFTENTIITQHTVVVAKYNTLNFVVQFVDYDDTVLQTSNVAYGKPAYAPTVANRTGYTFVGWDQNFDNVTQALTVKAQYQVNEHKVFFVVDGQIVHTETVEYGATIPNYEYSYDAEELVFSGWGTDLGTMPDNDVRLFATTTRYYFVEYYVGEELFERVKVLANQQIPAFTKTPTLPITQKFVAWQQAPQVMPKHNVQIYAITEARQLKNNVITLDCTHTDNGSVLRMAVTQKVNFAGIVGTIKFGARCQILTQNFNTQNFYAHLSEDGTELNFVWSQGVNTTEEVEIFNLLCVLAPSTHMPYVEVEQMMAITEDESIIPVDFTLGN